MPKNFFFSLSCVLPEIVAVFFLRKFFFVFEMIYYECHVDGLFSMRFNITWGRVCFFLYQYYPRANHPHSSTSEKKNSSQKRRSRNWNFFSVWIIYQSVATPIHEYPTTRWLKNSIPPLFSLFLFHRENNHRRKRKLRGDKDLWASIQRHPRPCGITRAAWSLCSFIVSSTPIHFQQQRWCWWLLSLAFFPGSLFIIGS